MAPTKTVLFFLIFGTIVGLVFLIKRSMSRKLVEYIRDNYWSFSGRLAGDFQTVFNLDERFLI